MASSKEKSPFENTCHYCLYFKPPPGSLYSKQGNCALHREWIDNAAQTTCSEMSNRRLQKRIYQLFRKVHGEWHYNQAGEAHQDTAILGGKGQHQESRFARSPKVYIIFVIRRLYLQLIFAPVGRRVSLPAH
jgi:hypothetical protein